MKLADFGFATLLNGKDGSGKLYTPLGTEGFMAPEICFQKPYNGVSVDLFAAAVINFIMMSRLPPFNAAVPSDPYYKLLAKNKGKFFWKVHCRGKPGGSKFYSKEFKDFTERLLAFNPQKRMNMEQVVNHEWIKGPVPSDKDISNLFAQKKAEMDREAERMKQAEVNPFNEGNMAYGGPGAFRDLDEEMMESLQLSLEFANLEKEFPNRNNKRVLDEFCEVGASVSVHYIRTNIKD